MAHLLRTPNDFPGYSGGLEKLLKDAGVSPSCFRSKARKYKVLHAGGPSRGQYSYSKFVHPIIKQAVQGGASTLCYFVTEGSQRQYPCCALVGDWLDVEYYVAHEFMSENGKSKYGLYYYHFNPLSPADRRVRPFLDFDFYQDEIPSDEKSSEYCWQHVNTAIETVNKALKFLSESNRGQEEEKALLQYVDEMRDPSIFRVAYGRRPCGNNGSNEKLSFHVTWPNVTFRDMSHLKRFLASHLGPIGTKYDTKVYTNGRLMRAPGTGKNGDEKAILLPCPNFASGSLDTVSVFKADHMYEENGVTAIHDVFWDNNIILIPPLLADPSVLTLVFEDEGYHNNKKKIVKVGAFSSLTEKHGLQEDQSSNDIMVFFKPLMKTKILPAIQEHRRRLLENLSLHHEPRSKAGVPVERFKISNIEIWRTGVFRVHVYGDTFCQYDHDGDTPLHHDEHKIAICISLKDGYYHQLCYSCQPSGDAVKKYSIFDYSGINIQPHDKDMSMNILDIKSERGDELFLHSVIEDVLYNPAISPDFCVYDYKNFIWVSDILGKLLLMGLRYEFCQKYIKYRLVIAKLRFEFALSRASSDEYRDRVTKKYEKECEFIHKIQACSPNREVFLSSLQTLFSSTFGYSKIQMNKQHHLVPLSDGVCYDVRTGDVVPRTKGMYFTSMLATNFKSGVSVHRDEECRQIHAWFLEISKGRADLAQYLKLVYGLVMTTLDIDRKFYCNLGPEGRNGKSVAYELLEVNSLSPLSHLKTRVPRSTTSLDVRLSAILMIT